MTLAIHESKNSNKVVRFLSAEQPSGLYYQLLEFTSKSHAKRIIKAIENNFLYGVYFTKSGRLRATFIP